MFLETYVIIYYSIISLGILTDIINENFCYNNNPYKNYFRRSSKF